MKKIGKLAAMIASATLALTMGVFSLTGCASGTDYTFEAENATLEGEVMGMDGTMSPAAVENGKEYKINGELVEGATLSGVGNFNGVGQKMTWTVEASADCSATLTLYGASALMEFEDNNLTGLSELDFGTSTAYKLTCNGEEAKLSGKLPGSVWENGWADMGAPGAWWNIGTATAKINLKQGKNTVVFEIVGLDTGRFTAGVNVDKIVINASAELK